MLRKTTYVGGNARRYAYCQLCHVHQHPSHSWSLPQILCHHLLNADFAEINIGDVLTAEVIPEHSQS